MRKRRQHIHRLITTVLLVVFAIALTPFSIFHHHEVAEVKCDVSSGVKCAHKAHVQNHAENCLICAAHFEKHFTREENRYFFFQAESPLIRNYSVVEGTYVQLIGTSLRGPPVLV